MPCGEPSESISLLRIQTDKPHQQYGKQAPSEPCSSAERWSRVRPPVRNQKKGWDGDQQRANDPGEKQTRARSCKFCLGVLHVDGEMHGDADNCLLECCICDADGSDVSRQLDSAGNVHCRLSNHASNRYLLALGRDKHARIGHAHVAQDVCQ